MLNALGGDVLVFCFFFGLFIVSIKWYVDAIYVCVPIDSWFVTPHSTSTDDITSLPFTISFLLFFSWILTFRAIVLGLLFDTLL